METEWQYIIKVSNLQERKNNSFCQQYQDELEKVTKK